jgi:hypothetical protein
LWVSTTGAKQSIGANSKEEVMQLIGGVWRQMQKDRKAAEQQQQAAGPKTGDRRARSQRKSGNKANKSQSGGFRKRGFKK